MWNYFTKCTLGRAVLAHLNGASGLGAEGTFGHPREQ